MESTRAIGAIFQRTDETETFSDGAVLFREGDSGDCMFAVRSGRIELSVAGQVVESVGPDGIFGELAIVDTGERSATATARGEVRVVRIDAKRFQFLVQQHPFFALDVMRVLAHRLRAMNERMNPGA